LAAVTHVDGSARVQTLASGVALLLTDVLTELARETDLPIALNTSLNGPGEPIVAHATDALAFLSGHAIDGLLIEDYLFRRPR
jgi:carbamoyltransferase